VPTVRPCSDLSPPRYLIGQRWYCSYPNIVECKSPEEVSLTSVEVEELNTDDLHFGESIYSPDQLASFDRLVQLERAREAYIMDTAHTAVTSGGESGPGNWGSGLSRNAMDSIVDEVAGSFIPGYKLLGRATFYVLMSFFILTCVKLFLTICIRVYYIIQLDEGCGPWIIAGLWGTLFALLISPARFAGKVIDDAVKQGYPSKTADAIDEEKGKRARERASEQEDSHSSQQERLYPLFTPPTVHYSHAHAKDKVHIED
jgi:hypothetical protein